MQRHKKVTVRDNQTKISKEGWKERGNKDENERRGNRRKREGKGGMNGCL